MKKNAEKMPAPAPANRMVKGGQTRTRATAREILSPLFCPRCGWKKRACICAAENHFLNQ